MTTPKQQDRSYTAAGEHTTAAAIGKQYIHEFPASEDSRKDPHRDGDGQVSSGQYVAGCENLRDQSTDKAFQIDYHHPLEKWVGRRPFRWLLRRISRPIVVKDKAGQQTTTTTLERILASYRNPKAPLWHRIKYWCLHKFIDHFRGKTSVETFRAKLAENKPTVRGLVIVARSVGEFGLTTPQRFAAPLFAVWNFTNRCNLACKHCYQDSEHSALNDELTLDEKLRVIDQMGEAYMPMLAFSGGEPSISKDILPCIRRAASYGMHLTMATNGTTMTEKLAGEFAAAGLRYVEISLDSVHADRHDAFRGQKGLWEKTVAGARVVTKTPGLRLGIAMCVHQGNVNEVADMIRFAEEDLGASCFAHFNFIPVGRGLKMVSGDITPSQREKLLALLNEKMQKGGMGVISTAPQLGRVCLAGAALESGRAACSHAGSGSGVKARVVAKYLGGCGAGRTYVCIEPNGNVTPCVYLPHRVMGNLRQAPLMDIYRSSVFWDILNDRSHRLHHCEVCAFKNYCGGCRARADAYFGHLHAGDPGCIFNNKHWGKLVADGVAVGTSDRAEDAVITPTRHGPA